MKIHINTFSFKFVTIAHENTLLTGLSSKEGTYQDGSLRGFRVTTVPIIYIDSTPTDVYNTVVGVSE